MAKARVVRTIAVGAALAGAAGYLAGVLSAPAKGSKTRKALKKTANSNMNDLEKQLKLLHTELGDLVSDAKGHTNKLTGRTEKKFGSALSNARDAKSKLREVISSIHEGDATDSDLSDALEDARRSFDHLKHFIKK